MGTGLYAPSADEAQTSSYGLLEEDDYRVRIDSFQEVNRGGQYAKLDAEGKPLPTVDIYLTPVAFANAEDAELVDIDGEPVNPEKHLVFFFDPHRLGTKPMVSRSRQFLASALGIAPDARVDLPGGLADLVGKELVATVGIKDGKNRILSTRPVRNRQRVRTSTPKPEPVAAETAESETDGDEF